MNIASYFKSGSLKKRHLSDQPNDAKDYKKPREGRINEFFALKSTLLEDVWHVKYGIWNLKF